MTVAIETERRPVIETEHKPRRSHARLRLGIPARLISLDGQQWVTLIDLSQSGARLVLKGTGKVSGGLLRWLDFEAFGDPAWQAGNELALQFDEPLCPRWLIETRQRAAYELNREVQTREAAREFVTGRFGLANEN